MGIDRRTMLKSAAVAGATALAGASPAMARERKVAPTNAVGLLYDTTRCVGCKACVTACREANEETRKGCSRTLIRQYSNGSEQSFVKTGCMHCIDPACAGACMLGALQKREFGIVTWNPDLCVGCRYCQVACPYNAPKFEWESATPRIVK